MGLTRKRNDFGAGYHTSQSPQNTPKNAIVFPSTNILYDRNGHCRNFNGFDTTVDAGGSLTYQLDNGWASMGSSETAVFPATPDVGSGNIIEYYNKSLIFVGSGTVKANFPSVHNATRTIGAAGALPKIAILNGNDWDEPVSLGFAPQNESPEVSIPATKGSDFTGLVSGVRAFKVAARRESTGAISDASPASVVLEYTNTSVLLKIPERLDFPSHWRIYATPAGFGNVGFFQQLPAPDDISETDIQNGTVNILTDTMKIKSVPYGVADVRELEIEFNDQDLLALQAPTNMFPPETCSFVSALGNVLILLGTYKGVGLSPSIPNMPEAFPPDLVSFISEPVVGVSRPASGFLYVLAQNSIWVAMMSGAVMGGAPIMSRSLVTNIGVKSQKAAVTVGDALYIFSSGGKPIRISPEGEIDGMFSDKVIEAFAGWDAAKTVVTFDEKSGRVLFCYNQIIMSYDLAYDRWNAPVDLMQTTGLEDTVINIVSGFTQDGVANIVWWNDTLKKYVMGKFDRGTTGSTWCIREGWDDWGDYRVTKDMVYVSLIYQFPDTIKLVEGDMLVLDPKEVVGRIYKNFENLENEEFKFTENDTIMRANKTLSVRSYHMNTSAVQLACEGYGHVILGMDSDVDIHNIK